MNEAKVGHGISEVKVFEAGNDAVFEDVVNIPSNLKFVSMVLPILISYVLVAEDAKNTGWPKSNVPTSQRFELIARPLII